MKKRKTDEEGFTLIEVIVTLVLVGITAALAGMWIVSVANGYVFAKKNAETTQKAQLAMARLTREFSSIKTVTTATTDGTHIYYKRPPSTLSGTDVSGAVTFSSPLLQFNGNTLTDSVSDFTLRYCTNDDLINNNEPCASEAWSADSRIIEIKLTLMGANGTTSIFTQRVTPRNL